MPKRLILALAIGSIFSVCLFAAGPAGKAPKIRSSSVWLNVDAPLKLRSLRSKVVLIDFWAFDCDPCKETVPHIEALHEKYSQAGLVVLGVHTPRTEDEKKVPQLRAAIKRMGIRYRVVVHSTQKIFADYRCDLWPTQFVIDKQGLIRLSHGGVGRYAEIEEAVQAALREK